MLTDLYFVHLFICHAESRIQCPARARQALRPSPAPALTRSYSVHICQAPGGARTQDRPGLCSLELEVQQGGQLGKLAAGGGASEGDLGVPGSTLLGPCLQPSSGHSPEAYRAFVRK